MLKETVPKGPLEDFERSLLYFERHGGILRFGSYIIDYHKNPGAACSSMTSSMGGGTWNRAVANAAAARRLVKKFPHLAEYTPEARHPITLRALQSHQPCAPSCRCGVCCLCCHRDDVWSVREAATVSAWCRPCKARHHKKCTRKQCADNGVCFGSHCICSGFCACSNQPDCPHKKIKRRRLI